MERRHQTYEEFTRLLSKDTELYEEALHLGRECVERFNDEAFINSVATRMRELPVVYNLVICKQVPCSKLATMIGYKSFRPLAEELTEVIFGKWFNTPERLKHERQIPHHYE